MKTSVSMEMVSPKKAAQYLAATTEAGFTNRNLSMANVKRIAGDMHRGHYYSNSGETIALCKKGDSEDVVINGQHRLQAIVYVKNQLDKNFKGCKLLITRGVPEEAFQFIDQGKRRDMADIMSIQKWPNPKLYASAGRDLWKWDKVGDPAKNVSGDLSESEGNIVRWIEENVPDLVNKKEELGVGNSDVCVEGILLALAYRWEQEDKALAMRFVEYIRNSDIIDKPNLNIAYAVKKVRKIMDDAKGDRNGTPRGRHAEVRILQYRYFLSAWNATQAGKFYRGIAAFAKAVNDNRWYPSGNK